MKFKVEKMMCGGCVNNVKTKLEALDGVTSAKVELESASAEVEGSVDAQTVVDTLSAAGYPTTLQED
ncbi:heavy metal-associated domain-containing protein [Candidatus Thiothrix sp. Deng01]|uniref:Heavy metal-associated domain-containing protein n=1 Tax=Candidatus Thiothrix phosphatis TaxID=3112415 RepID=A0ABU6CUJ2_9GAMM|nr:heavy metal-associated domain-containing protein [Candidatus Thiothrix sp. Deng01]MEB4590473.1 heavy metal-associated domain-containing protein [Candidatus Thiothrix sp. Deng01]